MAQHPVPRVEWYPGRLNERLFRSALSELLDLRDRGIVVVWLDENEQGIFYCISPAYLYKETHGHKKIL